MSGSPNPSDVIMVSVKEENICDKDDYQSIFEKLKKLHNIARTNDDPGNSSNSHDGNKLAAKRKTDLDLGGLSDDSALNSTSKTKRRRFSDSQDYSESDFDVRDFCPKKKKMYVISISNLPGEWNYDKIKQYVTDECGVNVLKMTDSRADRSDYQLRVRFGNEEQYQSVLGKLKGKEVEGKLRVEGVDDDDSDSNASDTTFVVGKSDIKADQEIRKLDGNEWDPEGLYGLKPEFLLGLNITPPLVKWVHVTNFRCEKSELRDVFEMAGRVVSCIVVQTIKKYAKIMYSHPLEAVQAISMLNDQNFYGQSLKVTLDPHAENALPLPKGLQNYGPGLGESGKPLRDVVREFERFVMGKPSIINSSLFCPSGQISSVEPYVPSKLSNSSETLGKFGPIGQKKIAAKFNVPNDNIRSSDTKLINNDPFEISPPGTSNTPSYSPKLQNNGAMFPTKRMTATPPVAGPMGSQNIPNRIISGPNMQGPPGTYFQGQRAPNYQGQLGPPLQTRPQFQGPNYHGVVGSNQGHFQGQTRPNFPGSGPNYSGPGPNYQVTLNNQGPTGPNCPPAPNFSHHGGPNFQGPGQIANRFPQDVRPIAPFNQRGPINNMNGPLRPRMFGPDQNNQSMGPRPVPPPMAMGPRGPNGPQEKGILVLRGKDPITLHITNLPPTVTFASVCGRLSKVGQVMSLEFTTPGCAVVRFGNPSEAEKCFQIITAQRDLEMNLADE